MPAAAWIEERHLAALGRRNYWGYNPVAFMAPDPGLAPGGGTDPRHRRRAGRSGDQTILDVVLNHTGEGDALGPTLSLRGLDNATYYRLPRDAPWRYVDDTGCGNTLAFDRPAPLRLAMDALRVWAMQAGVQGFRFDLATTLGRCEGGFDPAAPLLSAISQDPVLRRMKLIAEPWDLGAGGHRTGGFPAAWGEWNDRFRDTVRRFWRGDAGQLGDLATRLAGSADLFARRRVASRSINFIVAHDGFTLADLVSYAHKHNEANAENNRDGTNANFSRNNGVEGLSDDPAVIDARRRDQRALLATLLLARGTPMLAMGAEMGHSQGGNNNAYVEDNQTGWLDWAAADAGLLAWTRLILRLRHHHAALHDDRFLTGMRRDASLLPDVVWTDAAGKVLSEVGWQDASAATLVMTLAGETAEVERVSVILHRGPAVQVVLPPTRHGHDWHLLADSAANESADHDGRDAGTGQDDGKGERTYIGTIIAESNVTVAARSVLVLAERPRQPAARTAANPALLDRLARAAGIAPEWWDVDGKFTSVSDDTRLALLTAMRLPAATQGEARDTLQRLSAERDRRAVPLGPGRAWRRARYPAARRRAWPEPPRVLADDRTRRRGDPARLYRRRGRHAGRLHRRRRNVSAGVAGRVADAARGPPSALARRCA